MATTPIFIDPTDTANAAANNTSATFVQSGTRLTWAGEFASFSFTTESSGDCINRVGAALKNKYNLIVERTDNPQSWTGLNARTITMDLLSNMDRGNGSDGVEDINGNVVDEFANAGCPCESGRITQLTPPGGQSQNTGAPDTPPPSVTPSAPNPPSSTSCTGFIDCIGSGQFSVAFSNLFGQAEAGSIGFLVGGLVVVGLVVFLLMKSEAPV